MNVRPVSALHPSLQFLILVALCLAIVGAGNVLAAAIIAVAYGTDTLRALSQLDVAAPHVTDALWILQIIGTTLPLLLTPVVFALAIVKEPASYLKPNFKFDVRLLLIVLLIIPFSLPVLEVLSNINQKLVLPEFLRVVQDWMEKSEKNAEILVNALLKMDSVGTLIKNILLIGLATAVVEEFLFRGCLQTIFIRWTKNTHAAIWITAILFSAFHMQFFGFLPRVMLGVLFGYMVAYSGSIWPAVCGHFVNNGFAVLATYLYQQKTIKIDPDSQHVFNYKVYVISLIILLFLLWVYRYVALSKKQIPHY